MTIMRAAVALLAAFALSSCVLAPGKFTSKLVVNADRTFTYTYIGEVIAIDMSDAMKGLGDESSGDGDKDDDSTTTPSSTDDSQPTLRPIALQDNKKDKDSAASKAATEAKNRAIAEALSKEAGFRKVTYQGNGVFDVDYAISGTLDHAFLWPFNVDAEAVFPFIAVELRANGTVRMKAPGFGNDDNSKSMPDADQAASKMDGVFTLDTDAEIVSQDSEDGATNVGGRHIVTWKATPTSKTAPMAVLRFPPKK
jgi:hypothetical protein